MMKESRLLNHHYKAIEEQFDKLNYIFMLREWVLRNLNAKQLKFPDFSRFYPIFPRLFIDIQINRKICFSKKKATTAIF